jgi:hypothetical protein
MSGRQILAKDLFLRAAGLGLISLAVFAARHLYFMEHLPPVHQASPAEMAVAAIAYLSASAGVILAVIGIHIYDQVEIPARWAPSAYSPVNGPRQ